MPCAIPRAQRAEWHGWTSPRNWPNWPMHSRAAVACDSGRRKTQWSIRKPRWRGRASCWITSHVTRIMWPSAITAFSIIRGAFRLVTL